MGKKLSGPLREKIGGITFEKLGAKLLFEVDFNWIHKVVYRKYMNRMIKKHRLMSEDQCAQSGKHGNEGSMLKLLHCNVNSAMHFPQATVSGDLKNAFDSTQQAVACMSVRSMGVPAKIAFMFLLCFQTMSFHLSTGYGVSEDFFSSNEKIRFASLLQGSGLAPLAFMAMTALQHVFQTIRGFGHEWMIQTPLEALHLPQRENSRGFQQTLSPNQEI